MAENKKDAYYFSHDSNAQDDPKCMVLIDQLGMEGYGIFWALIEKLRAEAQYKLPLSLLPSFARRWLTSKEKIDAVVKSFGLFVIENDEFFSLRLKRSMETKSEKARLSANSRWNKPKEIPENADGMRSHANGMRIDAIKEKEIESKSNNKYISADKFYENEKLKVSNDSEHGKNYVVLVDFLFGKNETKEPLKHCLGIKKQISFDNFIELMKVKPDDMKIGQQLLKIENDPKYYKNKQSLYLTLKNWLTMKFINK